MPDLRDAPARSSALFNARDRFEVGSYRVVPSAADARSCRARMDIALPSAHAWKALRGARA